MYYVPPWRNHMLTPTLHTMDAFDELPDNFDQAYTLFSKIYGEAKVVGGAQAAGPAAGTDALLNDQEQQVFTKFLDNVLDDPKGAAESNEIKWLDQHFSGSSVSGPYQPRASYAVYHSENKISNDFYRGFMDANSNLSQVLPGQHPQASTHMPPAAAPNMGPAEGVIGAGGHIVPAIPENYDIKGYELKSYSTAPSIPLTPTAVATPLHGVHVSSGASKFSTTQAFSSACMAHVAASRYTSNQSPPNYLENSSAPQLEPKRSRTRSPSEPLPAHPQTSASLKQKREYLTENQVRINHINSEKRRRDLISHNFKEMCSLVPSVKDAPPNLPKATVLQNVYEFILEVADENKRIRAELEAQGIDCGQVEQNKLGEKLPDEP